MATRTRTRDRSFVASGTLDSYFGTTFVSSIAGANGVSDHESCFDSTQPRPYVNGQPLSLWRMTAEPLVISGEGNNGNTRYVASNYTPANRGKYTSCPSLVATDFAYYKTKALAQLNPSKPKVDIPVFLFELKDLPEMLHQLGRVLAGKVKPSDAAGGYLAYSFGWRPLFQDLASLLDFAKQVDQRRQFLEKMERGSKFRGGLTPKAGSESSTLFTGQYVISGLSPPILTAEIRTRKIVNAWYTARCQLQTALPTGFDERQWLAARAAFGLNLSAASIWEAIPWSWLVDYLLGIGNFLDASRNFIPWKCTEIDVMVKTTQTNELTGIRTNYAFTHNGGGKFTTVQKERSVSVNPSPSINLVPFLTGHQFAILASLVTASPLRRFGH